MPHQHVATFTHQTTLASVSHSSDLKPIPKLISPPTVTFSFPPSLDSTPTLTDFTYLCSPSSGSFSPDLKSRHYLHLSCYATPSILFHFPPLSPPDTDKYHLHRSVPRPSVRLSGRLFSYECEFSPFRKAASLWTLSRMIQMSLLIEARNKTALNWHHTGRYDLPALFSYC